MSSYGLYMRMGEIPLFHRSLFMGVLTDALRANLRQLAQSDARQLRELDKILKESSKEPKKLK